MKKNLYIRLLLIVIFSISLYSCIHDETFAESDSSFGSKEYSSKSLWKEDEKYIRNVKKIFEKYSDKNYVVRSGVVAWDYAITAGDENVLEVPVIKNGKVNFVLLVEREGNRVFFKRNTEDNVIKFFNILAFKDRKELSGAISDLKDIQSKGCITYEKTVTWTNTQTGAVEYVSHSTQMVCTGETSPSLPCDAIDIDTPCGSTGSTGSGGSSGGGGSNGSGYPYDQQTQDFIDNCSKLKIQAMNEDFKGKVSELNKAEIFNKDKETGYAAAYGPKTNYEPLANTDNDNLKLPPGNKYFGYMHVHLNKEGVVKIFSPADIFTFLTSCVRNAQEKGTMADAYAMVITSQGSYMLKYSGDGGFGVGPGTLDSWQAWYKENYTKLLNNDGLAQSNVEKLFTKFLEEKVKIEGLEIYKTNTEAATSIKLTLGSDKNSVVSESCP